MSVVSIASHRVVTSWPWYIVRGAGFVAAGLIVLLMLSGIGQGLGHSQGIGLRVTGGDCHPRYLPLNR